MRLPAFIAALGLLSACAATTSPPTHVAAADAAPAQVFPAISTETPKAVTRTLSSDAFGGRAPTTTAEERTIGYSAKQFAAPGHPPSNNARWLPAVPLVALAPAHDPGQSVSGGANAPQRSATRTG